MEFIIFIVIVAIVIAVAQTTYTSNKKKGMEEKLAELDDFIPTQKIMGNDGNSGIAVDEERKKICLIRQNLGSVDLDVLTYRDILSSEIFEDGITITKTSRGSQLGGALIGGLVLGGVGAIIGGLSSKKKSSDKVNRIDLQITVNRTSSPIHNINFMNVEAKKNGIIYYDAIKQARHWHGLLDVLIKRADSEDIAKEGELDKEESKLLQQRSVADELTKLAELQKQGLLSIEEFNLQKKKILAE